jgi:hypothetical protein
MTENSENEALIPTVIGDWWSIAKSPDLREYNRDDQQPLDFGIWQASDDTWQLVSCCRNTGCGGKGRLFFRWQSDSLTEIDWKEMGVFMESDANLGETIGGIQAPNVIKHQDRFFIFYGDWVNICSAWSSDGKSFERLIDESGRSGVFTEGQGSSARDPHVMSFNGQFYIYYTGIVDNKSAIYCRVSDDLRTWSDSVIVNSGGTGGSDTSDAECPFVVFLPEEQKFYLFRAHTRRDSDQYETSIFCSSDPLNFGIDNDDFKVATIPAECVRLIQYEQQFYISALKPDLSGIMMARLTWARRERPGTP